jgi:hypothetical protein
VDTGVWRLGLCLWMPGVADGRVCHRPRAAYPAWCPTTHSTRGASPHPQHQLPGKHSKTAPAELSRIAWVELLVAGYLVLHV